MKISKDKLKQLIAEEMSIAFASPIEGETPNEPSYDQDGRMAKQNLWKMAEYARELYELIDDNEDLEPWVEEKIAIAAFMMDSVGHYMQYEKHRGHEEGEGEEDHFEMEDDAEEPDYEDDDEEYEFDLEDED